MKTNVFGCVLALICFSAAAQTVPKALCLSKAHGVVFPSFSKYRVNAQPKLAPHPAILVTRYDHLFRTRIREAAKSKPNFSGHYVITWWGCGSGCAQFAIVDRETGKVYDPPFTNVAEHYSGAEDEPNWNCFDEAPTYKVESSLLVIEGCLNESEACGRHFYVMGSSGLRQIQFDPDQRLGDKQGRQ